MFFRGAGVGRGNCSGGGEGTRRPKKIVIAAAVMVLLLVPWVAGAGLSIRTLWATRKRLANAK